MLTRNQRAALALPLPLPMPNHDRFRNLQGQRFGRLFVQSYATRRKSSGITRHYWLCDCDCSEWAIVEATALTGGRTTSCGCAQSEVTIERNVALTVHGEAYGSVEYKTWERLKARCLNAKQSKFSLYGGRGITVCDRWRDSFPAFLEDMGRRPPGKTSIDRINGDRGYEPGNCRWADVFEQNRNRSSRR